MLLMDEPTSSLSQGEVTDLFGLMRRLRRERAAIVFISHRMDEIFEVAERVTVLRDGKFVAENPISEVSRESLVQLMIGRPLSSLFTKNTAEVGDVVVEVDNLRPNRHVQRYQFEIRAGEIAGHRRSCGIQKNGSGTGSTSASAVLLAAPSASTANA